MSSARIELSNGAGPCARAEIDRTKPAILRSYIGDDEWDQFCNQIDKTLQPINCATMLYWGVVGVFFVVFFGIFLFFFLNVAGCNPRQGPCTQPSPIVFIIPLFLMLALFGVMCFSGAQASMAQESVKKRCQDLSKQHPQLSFHVRYEFHYFRNGGNFLSNSTQYIDVSIDHNNSDPIGTGTNEISGAAKRLKDLKALKHHLSQEEYDKKRDEILDSV